jgi:hypothetical protein
MVIGGQAVLIYGEPRLTRDIDITLGADPESLPLLLEAMEALGLRGLVEEAPAFVKRTMVLPTQEDETGIRVDFIFSFTPYERKAIARAVAVKVGKASVRFAALEDVIIHKMIAGRPRDLEDVRSMLLRNPVFDLDYTEGVLAEFDRTLKGNYRKQFGKLFREAVAKSVYQAIENQG